MTARVSRLAGALVVGLLSPACATEYFVSTNGNDSWDGLSIPTSLRTIQRAANLAGPGDTVWIGGGDYREEVSATKFGAPGQRVVFAALGDEAPVIKGSDVVTGWVTFTNAVWVRPGWVPEPQQVFDDGISLQKIGDLPKMWAGTYTQVGTNQGDMTPGSFFYDTSASNLYVWLPDHSAPTASVMEASARVFCFITPSTNQNSWFHLKGLRFRHSNTVTVTNGWPAVVTGGNSIIEDCDVQWCDFAGIALGPQSRALRCIASNNGAVGMGATGEFFIDGCSVLSNNLRNINPAWHAGGIKIIPDCWGTVQGCDIGWNRGPGLWFDYCRTGEPIVARDNHIHDNAGDGLIMEVSKNVAAHHNLIVRNTPRSVYVSSAEGNAIFNNTIAGGSDWVAVEMAYDPGRTDDDGVPLPMRDNDFRNNIVYGSRGIADLAVTVSDSPLNTNNTSDHNCYYSTHNPWRARMILNRVGSGGVAYTNLAEWSAASGLDARSLSEDPLFLSLATDDFHLRSEAGTWSNGAWVACADTSPCIDTGDPLSAFANEPAFNGGAVNMGRHGNTAEASRSPDTDGDGLSDPMERHVTRSHPAMGDTDGDGMGDGGEWAAGTDPLDGRARFMVQAVAMADGAMLIRWPGVSGKRYRVERSGEPSFQTYEVIATGIDGAGPATEHIDVAPDPTRASAFYRVVLE